MQDAQSLTLTSGEGLLAAIVSDLRICESGSVEVNSSIGHLATYRAIWDTGATGSVVTQKVIDNLNLKPIGLTKVHGVGGEQTSHVYLLDFILLNGVIVNSLRVTLGKLKGFDALIGMDIITLGDFSITNLNNRTKMSFRVPSCVEVDYVAEAERGKYSRQERRAIAREQKKHGKA